MTTDTQLLARSKANVRKALEVHPLLVSYLAAGEQDAIGFPSSTPGAAPSSAPARVVEGTCRERTEHFGFTDMCGKQRPCPEHDSPQSYTATERAALNPSKQDQTHTRIDTHLRTITNALEAIHSELANAEHARNTTTPALCLGQTHSDSATHWATPGCGNIPEPRCNGLCDHCFTAMNRWLVEQGLEPVERSEQMCKHCKVRETATGRTDGLCGGCRMRVSRAKTTQILAGSTR